jgi:hypothetical protein
MRDVDVHRLADIPAGNALTLARRVTAMMNPLLAPELLKARQQKLLREAEVDRLARAARAEMPHPHMRLLARLAGLLALLARRAPRETEPAAPAILPPAPVTTQAAAKPGSTTVPA